MYKDVILFSCCIFIFTIMIQNYDSLLKRKEQFRKKQIGKGIKKFVKSPAGIKTFSILAAAGCGVATGGAAAAACGGLVANRLTAATNEQRQEDYKKRLLDEGIRRCKVLTGYESPLVNDFSNIKSIDGLNVEATLEACRQFRTFCTETTADQNLCEVYKTQCRLARSCSFYDSHLTEMNQSK